jgi:hypothetical protein
MELGNRPPHEMSYLTMKKLQYGGSRAQESEAATSTLSDSDQACIHIYLRASEGHRRARPMLTGKRGAIEYVVSAAREAAHFIFVEIVGTSDSRHTG